MSHAQKDALIQSLLLLAQQLMVVSSASPN